VNQKGETVDCWLKTPSGVRVEIYKNFIYVGDPVAWSHGSIYTSPYIMGVNEGDLVYKDLYLRAARGPQNGVYVVAWCEVDGDTVGIAGCGVYASRRVPQVTKESLAWFQRKRSDLRETFGRANVLSDIPECFRTVTLAGE
jgi:hypothetical protein